MVSSSVLSHPGASPVALKDSAGSASTPPSGILRARARIRPMSTAQKKLPAWPLLALLYGFPALWALGCFRLRRWYWQRSCFYLIIRGNVRVPGSLWGGAHSAYGLLLRHLL